MPLLPKNLHNLRDLREKNSPFRGDKQKFLVSFNFPIVALDGKIPFPWRSFFYSLPSGLVLFLFYPHTLAFPLAFVGVRHRGKAFPQFQCLRHKQSLQSENKIGYARHASSHKICAICGICVRKFPFPPFPRSREVF